MNESWNGFLIKNGLNFITWSDPLPEDIISCKDELKFFIFYIKTGYQVKRVVVRVVSDLDRGGSDLSWAVWDIGWVISDLDQTFDSNSFSEAELTD